jgi:hypothetical protein
VCVGCDSPVPHAGQGREFSLCGDAALAFAKARYSGLTADGTRVVPGAKPQPIRVAEIETAILFLRQLRKAIKPTIDSGTLKHICEDWGRENGQCAYVSRGALTAAAIALGYTVRAYRSGGNVAIGASKGDLAKIVASTRVLQRERIAARESLTIGS